MKIVWNHNPLLTVVELDEADRFLLWHLVKIKRLEETISEAHFDLDPEHQEWCRTSLKERCPVDFVADARKSLDYEHICGYKDRDGKSFDARVSEWTAEYATALAESHSGDCTCFAYSCLKCHVESLIGVDTIPGLGKHEASFIGRAFGPHGTIEAAIAYLADYEPKDVQEWGLPHVDRWREEAKRAHEWLVAYQREHFAVQTEEGT